MYILLLIALFFDFHATKVIFLIHNSLFLIHYFCFLLIFSLTTNFSLKKISFLFFSLD